MKYLITFAAFTAASAALAQEPELPFFDPANFVAGQSIDNAWLPMVPGTTFVIAGTGTEDGEVVREHAEISIQGPGPIVAGVATVAVLDRAYEDGDLVEETTDYFAQDRDGNVWYFGEDVLNFQLDDEGAVIGQDAKGSWLAGIDEAKPGLVMPARPSVGTAMFQEFAPANQATDFGVIEATGLTLKIGDKTYQDVVKIREGSTSETTLREFKYYAPGTGLIRAEEGLSESFDNPTMVVDRQP